MRARSINAWATVPARSIAVADPAMDSVSPRNETRTPSRRASSSRLASFTPASASGSTPSTDNRWMTSSLMGRHHLYMECGQVFGASRSRRTLEERSRRGRLRKRDHVAQRTCSGKEHGRAVEPDCEAAMRRGPGRQRGQQKAETRVDIRGRQTEVRKDFALNGRVGDTDRARPQLVAVVHGVVV